MAATGALESFLHRARRRHLLYLACIAFAWAASAAAAALILLLLLGTQVLDWYWPLLIGAAALALAVRRVGRSVRTPYRLAQQIDLRLGLHDGLSTAHHFGGIAPHDEEWVRTRLEVPGALIRAVPMPVPKAAYALCALVAACGGMLALRYGVTRSLSLQAPLAAFSFDSAEPVTVEARSQKSAVRERLEKQFEQMGLDLEQVDMAAEDSATVSEQAISAPSSSEAGSAMTASDDGRKTGTSKEGQSGEQVPEGSDPRMQDGQAAQNAESAQAEEDGAASGQRPARESEQPGNSQQAAARPNENSSLMDKMRDAMSNLMAKMNSRPRSGGQQTASSQANQTPGQKQQQRGEQRAQQAQGRSQDEGQPNAEESQEEGSQAAEQAQAGGSKSGDKSADQQGSPDAKSGVGKQDGDKAIRDAEQLAAMGKTSELIGRRAAEMSGEMTVETSSSKQQLKTAYSRRKALHADAGAEVHRGDIPLIYQPYIQRYFEQVRKQQPRGKTP